MVKWNGTDQLYAWKYPSQELSTWTQLIVSESQEAVLIKEGKMIGPFTSGHHTLDTKNIPLLSDLFSIPFGGKSPFTAEVWFVNKAIPLDIKWGTTQPIQLKDPMYGVMLPVRAFGQFAIQIKDTRKFLIKLVGTMPVFSKDKLVEYFRGLLMTRVKDAIATTIIKERISILEITAELDRISSVLHLKMDKELQEFGIELIQFFVNSINTPEDDHAVLRLKEALAKKAEMDILGYSYQQERSFDTMQTAAANEGQVASSLLGAGVGLGMGVGVGNAIGNMTGQIEDTINPVKRCNKCNTTLHSEVEYCHNCGTYQEDGMINSKQKISQLICDKCGAKAKLDSKFCPECGDPFILCKNCGTDNAEDAIICRKCGQDMPKTCSSCGEQVTSSDKFCPSCGITFLKECSNCSNKLLKEVKFCPKCGSPT